MSSGSWIGERRRLALPHLRPGRLLSVRGLGILVALLLVAGLGWLWFRGSSFVRIKRVTVTGLSGPDVQRIRQILTAEAESMTTMNLSVKKLEDAVSQYPVIKSLSARTHFPHAASVAVNEQVPVAAIMVGGQLVVVDGADKLLSSSTTHGLLPTLELKDVPSGDTVTAPGARTALKVLQAAPYAFIAKVRTATYNATNGVVLQLRSGPELYFGLATEATLKWTAAMAVLADSGSAGAQYIDVSDPRRPAAGVPVSSLSSSGSTN